MILDFTHLINKNLNSSKVKLQKRLKFLDKMVRLVFYSTFIFTFVSFIFIWCKDWEQAFTTLIERWFTVMVGELIVMGAIQIAKEIINKEANNNA